MSPYSKPAPRGFRWADSPVGRTIVMVLAVLSLMVSLYVGYQYVGLINCLQETATADAKRTAAIAEATDAERAADLALLTGPIPGGPSAAALRQADIAARQHTDNVRAAHPAPPAVPCS